MWVRGSKFRFAAPPADNISNPLGLVISFVVLVFKSVVTMCQASYLCG